MRLWAAALVLLGGAFLAGCADETSPDEPDARLPASALDAAVKAGPSEDSLAMQVFARRLRDSALRIEGASIAARLPLDQPALAKPLRDEFQRCLVDAVIDVRQHREQHEAFARDRIAIEVVDLPGEAARSSQLRRISASINATQLRGVLAHPESPALDAEELPVFHVAEFRSGAASGPRFALYGDGLPSLRELENAAAVGAKAWLLKSTEEGSGLDQFGRGLEIEGSSERGLLPLALVFTCAANDIHLQEIANNASATITLRIERSEVARARAIRARISAGPEARHRLVVSTRALGLSFGLEAGSRALTLATMLEAGRVMALNFARDPSLQPACDIELIHPLDGSRGKAALPDASADEAILAGWVQLGPVLPRPQPTPMLYLGLEDRGPSALERAFAGVAVEFRGRPGAWTNFGFDLWPSAPAALPKALGQERLPRLGLFACGAAAPRPLRASADWPAPERSLSGLVEAHPLLGTSADEVLKSSPENHLPQTALGRALILGLLRAGRALAAKTD